MPTAISLSGGGAKGDFQVGALRLLYDLGIRPDIVCGVSVGAINAARLADVAPPAGPAQKEASLRALEEIWSSLRTNSDMWVEEPWYRQLQRAPQDALDFAVAALNPLIPLHGLRIGMMLAGGNLRADLGALAQVPNAESLYNLGPIAARLQDPGFFQPGRVADSGIRLRIGTVSLSTGNLRWITENGALVERDGRTPVIGPPPQIAAACQPLADAVETAMGQLAQAQQDFVDARAEGLATARYLTKIREAEEVVATADNAFTACLTATPSPPRPVRVNLVQGVLASASIPMFFPTVPLGLGDRYVDGGLREIAPVQAAIDAGATEIYAICASATGTKPDARFTSPAYERSRQAAAPRMVDLLMRTIDVFLDEIFIADIEPRRSWPEQGVFIIAPTLDPELHDLMTIEPGLIDIAGAYGYMRAWDAVVGATRDDGADLAGLTDQIVEERREIWELDFAVNGRRTASFRQRRETTLVPVPDVTLLSELRRRKRRLASLVEDRLARGGAVPIDREWWTEHWDRHAWEPLTGSPWDRFVAQTGEEPAGPPPMVLDPPAAAVFPGGRTDVVAIGLDHAFYRQTGTAGVWPGQWERLGGSFTAAPAACEWAGDRLEVFGRGLDRRLYHGSWRGGTFLQGDWEPLGGGLRSKPSVVASAPNRLDVFALGHRRQVIHKVWDGSTWLPSTTDWEDLGGTLVTPPVAVSRTPGTVDVFALGLDAALWHKAWDGSAWRPSTDGWERLGGVHAHPPTVVSWDPRRLDVFTVGLNGRLQHKAWDPEAGQPSDTGWEELGGALTCAPAAVAVGSGRLDVFARGPGRGMFHKAWDGTAWRPSADGWVGLGGSFMTAPMAIAHGDGRMDVFALGLGRGMFHKAWDGSAWRPSPDGWDGLGGSFAE